MNWPQRTLLVSILVGILISLTNAQQRETIVISAASPAPAAAAAAAAAPAASEVDTIQGAIKTLQEMKAANDELLKKQEATLQQLDELQKAAEQLKVFTKRG